ncbi:DUF3575 domain-containing protein [Dysgonomonas reticulitermitis]
MRNRQTINKYSLNALSFFFVELWLVLLCTGLQAQQVAQKTNLLYWATTTPNAAMEFSLNRKLTLDIAAGYNPWDLPGKSSLRHWLVQPELRYWMCQSFEGHFFGVHAIYSKYNVGNISFIKALKDYSYNGNLYGGGISYGYHFPLKGRWGLELTAGIGYVHMEYGKYICRECLEKVGSYTRDYFGPTKAGISLIYMIK